MSVNKNYYVIVGYDLTGYKTDKYKEWKWSEDWEELTNYQKKDEIQLFDDPMSGNYLYLGYILAVGDECHFDTTEISINTISSPDIVTKVCRELNHLINIGVVNCENFIFKKPSEYKIIVFEECY